MAKGFIEYVDTEEEETTMIAMTINVRSHELYMLLCNVLLPNVDQKMLLLSSFF